MRTRYRIDTYQKTYFVIDSFQQLFEATFADFEPVYGQLQGLEAIPAGSVLNSDGIFHSGSGEGWLVDGDI
jgi:phenylalanine-4-hydroxylase